MTRFNVFHICVIVVFFYLLRFLLLLFANQLCWVYNISSAGFHGVAKDVNSNYIRNDEAKWLPILFKPISKMSLICAL